MEAIDSSLGWGRSAYLALALVVWEAEASLHGRPLRRTGSVWPFQFMCRMMRERGSEGAIQPPRAKCLGGTLYLVIWELC